MDFDFGNVSESNCLWDLWLPETLFLDIGDAEDREAQPLKLHFASINITLIAIQHRYQEVGKNGFIKIFRPLLFLSKTYGI